MADLTANDVRNLAIFAISAFIIVGLAIANAIEKRGKR